MQQDARTDAAFVYQCLSGLVDWSREETLYLQYGNLNPLSCNIEDSVIWLGGLR